MYSPSQQRKKTFLPQDQYQQQPQLCARSNMISCSAMAATTVSKSSRPPLQQAYGVHSFRSKKKTVSGGVSTASFSPKQASPIAELKVITETSNITAASRDLSTAQKRAGSKNERDAPGTKANIQDETSPYFSGENMNSQVKSQNYYKRYFHKKLPAVLSSVQATSHPAQTSGLFQQQTHVDKNSAQRNQRNQPAKHHHTQGGSMALLITHDRLPSNSLGQSLREVRKSTGSSMNKRGELSQQLTSNVTSMESTRVIRAKQEEASQDCRPLETTFQEKFGTFGEHQMIGSHRQAANERLQRAAFVKGSYLNFTDNRISIGSDRKLSHAAMVSDNRFLQSSKDVHPHDGSITRSLEANIRINLPVVEQIQTQFQKHHNQLSSPDVFNPTSFTDKSKQLTQALKHQSKVVSAQSSARIIHQPKRSSTDNIIFAGAFNGSHSPQNKKASLSSSRNYQHKAQVSASQNIDLIQLQNVEKDLNVARGTIDTQTEFSPHSALDQQREVFGKNQKQRDEYVPMAEIHKKANIFSIKQCNGQPAQIIPPVFDQGNIVISGHKQVKKRNRRAMMSHSRDIHQQKINSHSNLINVMQKTDLSMGNSISGVFPHLEGPVVSGGQDMNEFLVSKCPQAMKHSRDFSVVIKNTQEKSAVTQITNSKSKMKDFIQEFREFQNIRASSSLKANETPSSQMVTDLLAVMSPIPPQKEYTSDLRQRSGQKRTGSKDDKNQKGQDLQRRITSSSRMYSKINQIRKSFEKQRPGPQPQIYEPAQNFTSKGSQQQKTAANGQKHIRLPNAECTDKKVKHQNQKSTNQLRKLVKANSGDHIKNRTQFVNNHSEYEQDEILSESSDGRDYEADQSHMIIKNLVIENTNLRNCNVFIQGDSSQHQYVAPDVMGSLPKQANQNNTSLKANQRKFSKAEQSASAQAVMRRQKVLEKQLIFEPKESPMARRNTNSRVSRGAQSKLLASDQMRMKKSITATSGFGMSGKIDLPANSYQVSQLQKPPTSSHNTNDFPEQLNRQLKRVKSANKHGHISSGSKKKTSNPLFKKVAAGAKPLEPIYTASNRQGTQSQFRQSQPKPNASKSKESSANMRQTFTQGFTTKQQQQQSIMRTSPSHMSLSVSAQATSSEVQKQKKPDKLTLRNFQKNQSRGPLGVGHFGQVWLVKYQASDIGANQHMMVQQECAYDDNFGANAYPVNFNNATIKSILPLTAHLNQYALKMIDLNELKKQKQIEHLFNERDVLCQLQDQREHQLAASCFPKLYATFNSKSHANFLMEPIEGLTLSEYQKEQVCIKLEDVKFFAAKTLVLLDYLHQQRIIYRDLKLENIIIDQASGDLKLVDFGFAKDLSKTTRRGGHDRTYTKCGTPGYTAPEVLLQEETNNTFNIHGGISKTGSPVKTVLIKSKASASVSISKAGSRMASKLSDIGHTSAGNGYSYPADVWSWGVLVCELIGGFNPFQGATLQETFDNITRIQTNWPRNLDTTSSQMLHAIFQRDAALRPTLQSLKRSSFFSGVNWNHLESCFEQIRNQTRDTVQKIKAKQKQGPKQHWVTMREEDCQPQSFAQMRRASPHITYNRRNQLTEIQLKAINDALANF